MNVADAWLLTTMLSMGFFGVFFGVTWANATKARTKRVGQLGFLVALFGGFLSIIALIWFSTISGIYLGGNR